MLASAVLPSRVGLAGPLVEPAPSWCAVSHQVRVEVLGVLVLVDRLTGLGVEGDSGMVVPDRAAARDSGTVELQGDSFTLRLSYRAPFDWSGLLDFLRARALTGIEQVTAVSYSRTVKIGSHTGWVRVTNSMEKSALLAEVAHSLMPALPALLGRLRNVFDLSARPDVICAQLGSDPLLASAVTRNPGIRVPGAFDGFELALRAILGQQITVKAATTLAGRFVQAFGDPATSPIPGLTHTAPLAPRVAAASVAEVAALGIVRSRAQSIVSVAEEIASGRLVLDAGADPSATMADLVAIRGIGKWTAQYIAMRALRWPDAFPKEDIVLRKQLGLVSASRAEEMSQAWRPWRSYATLHLWNSANPVQGSSSG